MLKCLQLLRTFTNNCFAKQEAQQYAEENNLLFMETSAKTAMNVNDIFLAIGMLFVTNFCGRASLVNANL